MHRNGMVLRSGCVVALWALAPGLARAYIDPGNGAYMVQALFTLAGAALFYLRHPIRSIRAAWAYVFNRGRDGACKEPLPDAVEPESGAISASALCSDSPEQR